MPMPTQLRKSFEDKIHPQVRTVFEAMRAKPNKATKEAMEDFKRSLSELADKLFDMGDKHRKEGAGLAKLEQKALEKRREEMGKVLKTGQASFENLVLKHELRGHAAQYLSFLHLEAGMKAYNNGLGSSSGWD